MPKPVEKKSIDKWKKKKWVQVLAPKVFKETQLGQSPAYSPNDVLNRRISTSLMFLTGSMRDQDVTVTFEVIDVKGDTAYTQLKQYLITSAAVKRKVRRNKDKIDISFKCKTADNKEVVIKPLIITGTKASKAVKSDVRHKAIELTTKYAVKKDYDSLVIDIVHGKLQKEIRSSLAKITPVRIVDIRMLQLVK